VRAILPALAADPHAAEAELRLTSSYGLHWMKRGMWAEGREALQRALARPDADHASAPYGQALMALGNLEYRIGELESARRHYEEARVAFQTAGTLDQLASIEMNLGNVAWYTGQTDDAEQWYASSYANYQRAGTAVGAAGCLSNIAAIALAREDYDRVERVQSEALTIFESLGVTDNICLSLFQLGIAALVRQDYDLGRVRLERALALAREADNRWNILAALDNLTGLENFRDRPEAARESLRECLVRLRDMPDPVIGLSSLENTASVILTRDPDTAAALLAAAAAQRVQAHMPGLSYERREIERRIAQLRAALGESRFTAASAEGAALSLADALARAEACVGLTSDPTPAV
jgi:tetratricopeptide (TPR) repeat protein